jgi:hypothetical protein
VTSGKKGSGQGLKYNHDDIAQAIHCLIRMEKILRSHSSIVKPMLTEENKLHRLEFCLNERANNCIFKEMYDWHTW